MTYESLFDQHYMNGQAPANMHCKASLNEVLEDLVYDAKSLYATSEESRAGIILGAPRIIRGVLDYSIDSPIDEKPINVINSATNTALAIYSDPRATEDHISEFVNFLEKTGNLHFLNARAEQIRDNTTWKKSDSQYCAKSANYLVDELNGEDMVFLMTGHGGVMAGMDVFLRYKDASGSENSFAYPIRLSTSKKLDTEPRFSNNELKYIKRKATGKNLVVFDEDCYSGNTMRKFRDYIKGEMFPKKPVIYRTNFKNNIHSVNFVSSQLAQKTPAGRL